MSNLPYVTTTSIDDLSNYIELLSRELSSDSQMRQELRRCVPDTNFPAARIGECIKVHRSGMNFDDHTIEIIVALSPLISGITEKILLDIWTQIILPRLVHKFGRNSMAPKP